MDDGVVHAITSFRAQSIDDHSDFRSFYARAATDSAEREPALSCAFSFERDAGLMHNIRKFHTIPNFMEFEVLMAQNVKLAGMSLPKREAETIHATREEMTQIVLSSLPGDVNLIRPCLRVPGSFVKDRSKRSVATEAMVTMEFERVSA